MLDEIDTQIVNLLESHPRMSSRAIADATATPESTVQGRLRRLFRTRQVSSTIFVHPDIANEPLLYQMKLTLTEDVTADEVSARGEFASSPWTAISPSDGRLVAQFSASTYNEMLEGLDRIRALPGVSRAETQLVTRIYVGTGRNVASGEQRWSPALNRPVDAIDMEIIRALRSDGRRSYTDLSSRVGLTVPATRRRVIRLVDSGIMRFVTQVNDRSIVRMEASIELTVPTEHRLQLIDELTSRKSVRYVIEQTGPYDLACYLVTDSVAALAAEVGAITTDGRVLFSRTDPFVVLRDETSWTSH
jgi:DNA-binding Lrp family transcriptional regulator